MLPIYTSDWRAEDGISGRYRYVKAMITFNLLRVPEGDSPPNPSGPRR